MVRQGKQPSPRGTFLRDGAKADARDVDGRTPLSHAAERSHLNIIKILSRSNANRGLKDKQGQRPVDYAQRHGRTTQQCICKDWMLKAEFYGRKNRSSAKLYRVLDLRLAIFSDAGPQRPPKFQSWLGVCPPSCSSSYNPHRTLPGVKVLALGQVRVSD